ncbi:hypothetical protein EH220_03460 [bacterium]|nr:MAG: hypothetical protein EH220_03460 [bacterium]
MKSLFILIVALACAAIGFADEPVQVNFNLVQVNHYPGQENLQDEVVTPGKRLVIDLNESSAMLQYLSATSAIPIRMRTDNAFRKHDGGAVGAALGWETSAVLYAPSKQDSFLVTSSRIGCPGTEVGPSVAVAFSNGRQWSNPPIRFGPLTEMTVCPLGNGYQLEVNGRGTLPPLVRVIADRSSFGSR